MSDQTAHHLKHEAFVGGGSNALFNCLAAWLMLRGGTSLTWRGDHSFVVDIVATAFILPLIVALIVIPLQRNKLHKGQLMPMRLESPSALQSLADLFPASLFASAILFGLISMMTIAPLTLAGFYLADVSSIAPLQYALFKGVWAGAMAAVMVLPMVLYALRPIAAATTT